MGLFVSNDTLNCYSYNSGYHTDLFSPSDYTIYDEGVDINYTTLGYEIVAESQQEWNTLMKQVALNELAVYSSNGCREVLYEAVDFSALFTRIKNFFKKLADKVKAIFHSFMAKLSSILSRDSTFAKKYGNEFIRKVQNIKDDFEFKGYTFTIKKFSNRDDITFDSQLANIYINKAKVGETKIDNSIVNLLNSRGSVSDSLLNPSTFVESVGYYGDYYVLNEYNTQNVTEYDKIYIMSTYGNEVIFGGNNIPYIKGLYKENRQITKEEKERVNKIFDSILKYDGKNNKVSEDNYDFYYFINLLGFLSKTLNKSSTAEIKNILNTMSSVDLNNKAQFGIFITKLNNLLKKIKNNKFDASLLGQYNPTAPAPGSSSGNNGSNNGQSSSNNKKYTEQECMDILTKIINDNYKAGSYYEREFNSIIFKKLDDIAKKYKGKEFSQSDVDKYKIEFTKLIDEFNKNHQQKDFDTELQRIVSNYQKNQPNDANFNQEANKLLDNYKNNKNMRTDEFFKELEDLVGRYNKAYQAAQASGSGPSSSGSGTAQQSQNNGNTMKKDDFKKKFKEIRDSMTNSNYRTEFFNKVANILVDNDAEISKPDIEKSIADKILKEIEDLVDEYNKKPKNPSGGNSGDNSGGSGSVGGSSGSGSVGGRNVDYNSPAEKADVYKRANISIQDNSEDIHDTIRGAVAKLYTDNSSAADSYNERDFKNELFKLFRNGADKKDSIPASEIKKNASAIVDEVTTYKNTKDMAKESTNTVVKAIDSVINKLDEYIKRSNKNWTEGSDGTLTSNFTNLLTTITNVFFKTSRSDIVLANNIYLTALKDRCIQNKNIMVKVIAGYDSKKMKNTNESYDYDNDYIYNNNSNSFLDKGYWYYLQVK